MSAATLSSAVLGLLVLATAGLAGEPKWTPINGRFARFSAPPGLVRNVGAVAIDGYLDPYKSPSLEVNFDSEVKALPPGLQQPFEKVVAAWSAQRKEDWKKQTPAGLGGLASGHDDPADLSGNRYYLYLGFAAGEDANFSLHLHFRDLKELDAIERLLKSIDLKAEGQPAAPAKTPSPK